MNFIDAHTHVQFAAFDKDWKETIERALRQNTWLVNVGTQNDTSRRAVEIAHEYKEGVYAAVGLHPVHTEKSFHDAKELGADDAAREFTSRGEIFDVQYYRNLARDPKVVAIGECGLDYYRLGDSTKKCQAEAFTAQITLAREVGKPLMIHCRNAFPDLIALLKSETLPDHPGIVHFFSGTKADARELLDLGFCFTFGGVITFARDYDEVIEAIPVDRILSETDAPYVTPAPYRGKRNEPAHVVEVVKKLAEIKNIPVEKMSEQIFKNSKSIFGI